MRIPALVAFACLLASPAQAWVQTQVKSGCGERWLIEPIPFAIHDKGGLDGISDDAYRAAVEAAFATWQAVTCAVCPTGKPNQLPLPCPSHPVAFQTQYQGFAPTTGLGPDCSQTDAQGHCQPKPNGNFVVAVHQGWPFGASVISTTVITANLATGEIVDADIGLDDGTHDFCTGACKPGQFDLCSTLTHEVGHFLGLDHTPVAEATMYASAPAQEDKKCSLADDDRGGLCAIYATTCDPASVPQPGADTSGADTSGQAGGGGSSGDCHAGPVGQGGGGWIASILGLFLLWRRTRPA